MPPACDLCAAQLNLQSWVDWTPLHDFAKSTTFLERWRSVASAHDVARDFFRSRWASPSINLVCLLLGWPFYTLLFIFLHQSPKAKDFLSWLKAFNRFQTSSAWSRTFTNSEPCLIVEVIVIIFMFSHLFAIVCLIDYLLKRPIPFGFTKPLVLVICSLILDLWLFDDFRSYQTDIFD